MSDTYDVRYATRCPTADDFDFTIEYTLYEIPAHKPRQPTLEITCPLCKGTHIAPLVLAATSIPRDYDEDFFGEDDDDQVHSA